MLTKLNFRMFLQYVFIAGFFELTLSWHPCNPAHCFKEPYAICLTPQTSHKSKYCDLNMKWGSSCRTHECGYVFDFTTTESNLPEISGSITALRNLDLVVENSFESPEIAMDVFCWSYLAFPKKFSHLYYRTSKQHVKAPERTNISLEFKSLAHSYVISIPCSPRTETSPSLAKKDAILYIFNQDSRGASTEYKIEWLATSEKKTLPRSWNHKEIFRQASIDPVNLTTTPQTTTPASTTARPPYRDAGVPPLEIVSNALHDNHVKTQVENFTSEKTLKDSSEKTMEITKELAKIIKEESINLKPEVAISYITAVSETTNNIVAEQNAETWQKVKTKTAILNQIIENVDNTTKVIVESMNVQNIDEIKVVKQESVAIVFVPTQTGEPVTISPSINVEVGLSRLTVDSLSRNSTIVLATSIHSGAETCYDDIPPTDVDIVGREYNMDFEESKPALGITMPFRIISEIVSVNIKPRPMNNEIITLVFRHIRNISDETNYTLYCAYINKISARWTNLNCNITETNRTHTIFVSKHLTNFAILMQIVDFEIPEQHLNNLSLITYIGCSISVFCLVLSLCVFALVKNVLQGSNGNIRGHRTERYHLHANLALAMLLGQVTFLVGAAYPPGTDSCKATAILLHFFYLGAFSWMLVEGLHLYNLVVKVFSSAQSKLGYYYMIGWGTPLLICVISVAAAFGGYGEVANCWLDIQNTRVIWAFVGPALFVVLVNIIILIKVTRIITTLAKSQDNCLKCTTDKATIAICAKAIAVLMPILGATWIFGVLAVNQDTIVFQYIFAIFNSLQGFFLFVFHCVFNSETRASLMYRTKSIRTDLHSRSATSSKSRRQTKVELVKNAEQVELNNYILFWN